jgi:hypothetical protein
MARRAFAGLLAYRVSRRSHALGGSAESKWVPSWLRIGRLSPHARRKPSRLTLDLR